MPQAAMKDYALSANEEVYLEISGQPMEERATIQLRYGINNPVVAEITLADQGFAVIDTRENDSFGADLVVVNALHKQSGGKRGYKGLWLDKSVVLGRSEYTDRFDYSDYVSSRHIKLAYNGLFLVLENLRPTNKTMVSGDFADDSKDRYNRHNDNIRGDFTYDAGVDRHEKHEYGLPDNDAPYGYHKNHPIIGRKSASVRNGVYFTTRPMSEAVVVDDKSQVVRAITNKFLDNLRQQYGLQPTMFEDRLLNEVATYTASVLPYRLKLTEAISKPYAKDNGLVGLSTYITERAGVCRHQCLLAAHLIEELVDNGYLLGSVGVERNHDLEANGAHAWAVFKGFRGTEIVVDPAQKFVGTRPQAAKQGRWKYQLPQER